MTNILLALILLGVIFSGFLFFRIAKRLSDFFDGISEAKNQIVSFLSPPADGQPSSLSNFIQVSADMIGRSVAMTLKATLMGKASAEFKQAIGEQIAGKQAELEGLGVGSLLDLAPKTLKRNPGLLDLAIRFLPNLMGKTGPVSNPGNGNRPKFNLGG